MKKVLVVFVGLLFVFFSCTNAILPGGDEGDLRVSLPGSSRSITPEIDADKYVVSVSNGPSDNQSITVTGSTSSVNFTLILGTYTVTVDALNINGETVGRGSSVVEINPGNNSVTITVNALSGNGVIEIDIDYELTGYTYPSVGLTFENAMTSEVFNFESGVDFSTGEITTNFVEALPSGTYFLTYTISSDPWTLTKENIQIVILSGITTYAKFTHNFATASLDVEVIENYKPVIYPEVVWDNGVDDGFSISRSIAPSSPDFFDYQGLTFTASYGSETGEFYFTDASLMNMITIVSGTEGNLSFFSNHTVEITSLWLQDDGQYYEKTYSQQWNATTGWETILDADTIGWLGSIESDGGDGWLIGFKTIALIAPDLVNYYTWTNPSL